MFGTVTLLDRCVQCPGMTHLRKWLYKHFVYLLIWKCEQKQLVRHNIKDNGYCGLKLELFLLKK